jgi:hypothetical protein
MPIKHAVQEGDSVVKLAAFHGFRPDTIWNYPDNAALKAERGDMNILFPSDVVVIPDKRLRQESRATDLRHVFRRRGVPMIFRVQLFTFYKPCKNKPYVLEVDGSRYEGVTDNEGRIERWLPNSARRGRLSVEKANIDVEVLFGHMDPITQPAGVQKRLENLGFYCGPMDGSNPAPLAAAVRSFQELAGLDPTGKIDPSTRDALASCHDQPARYKAMIEAVANRKGAG